MYFYNKTKYLNYSANKIFKTITMSRYVKYYVLVNVLH